MRATLAHYRIVEELGSGGMGVVYKATDTRLGRDVAIKVVRSDIHDPMIHAALHREARLACSLNHPAVVTVYDIAAEDGLQYIVMEYVAGVPLSRLIPTGGFPVERAIDLALRIGEGAAAAHDAGIVHRDLKPGNVLVCDGDRVKILDFGLARAAAAQQSGADETMSIFGGGKIVGTFAYMAPEQARGETVDQRADIFSYGVMLYELLSGHLPFRAPNPVALLRAMQFEVPTPLSRVRPELPRELNDVVMQSLAKDAFARFQSIRDMTAALQALRSGAAVPARTAFAAAGVGVRSAAGTDATTAALSELRPPTIGSENASIAVLPFRSIGGDKEDEYLAAGISAEVTRALTGVPGLRIAPHRAAFQVQGEDIRFAANVLNTRYVLTGSLRRAGQRLRVIAELSDAFKERVLWSKKYDSELHDIFDVQEEISRAIVQSLGGQLIRANTDFAIATPAESLDAWGLVRKAYYIWNYEFSPAGVVESISLLRRALELEPGYAAAQAYLGMALIQSVIHGISRNPAEDAGASVACVETALKNGPSDPEVLENASIVFLHCGMYDRAVEVLKRAVSIAPYDLVAWGYLGFGHACAGGPAELKEAHRILRQLVNDAPDHPSMAYWAQFLLIACVRTGDIDDAVRFGKKSIELQPGFVFTQLMLANALCLQGNIDEARKVAATIPLHNPTFTVEQFELVASTICRSKSTAELLCSEVKRYKLL